MPSTNTVASRSINNFLKITITCILKNKHSNPKGSGHRHATISLICMSTHKATAARCFSYHQATYGQPRTARLPQPFKKARPKRALHYRVNTIATNSYQTTCTVSERTFNKRQHANARYRVGLSLFTHYDRHFIMKVSIRC